MDRDTLKAYDTHAADYARDWHDQPPPADLHAIIHRLFHNGATADIGCGSGREVGWLNANGFPAVGFDASPGLLAEATRRYPGAEFRLAALPELAGIAAEGFDNVLCETVIMHLPREAVAPSARRLVEIVRPGGILYLSWRVETDDRRDKKGRLYSAFDNSLVFGELRDMAVLLDEEVVSASSSAMIHRLVARKT
jgi:SAM-dependent methyltransferase